LRGLLAEVREKGLSPEEFDIAKRSLINGSGFLYNTPSKRMENAIIEKMLNLKEGFFRSYASSIENLTLDEVNAAFKRFLAPDKMTFMVLTTVTRENERPLATALQVSEKHVRKKDYRAD
jgi:predicted Zn-dependent peptidase